MVRGLTGKTYGDLITKENTDLSSLIKGKSKKKRKRRKK